MREHEIISQEMRRHRAGTGTAFKQVNACHVGRVTLFCTVPKTEPRSKGKFLKIWWPQWKKEQEIELFSQRICYLKSDALQLLIMFKRIPENLKC